MDKSAQRAQMLRIRTAIPLSQQLRASAACVARLRHTEMYQAANKVAIYYPLPGEISPLLLLQLDGLAKQFYLPVVQSNDDLKFARYNLGDTLRIGKLRTKEPAAEEKEFKAATDLQLVILPGVAFDKRRNRLGMGRGCYDRALRKAIDAEKHTDLHTLMLAAQEQQIPTIDTEEHDVKPLLIVTPNEIFAE